MDVREHWELAEFWAADAEGGQGRHSVEDLRMAIDMARMHYDAVSATALFRQHYPAVYADAMRDGSETARAVAEAWPGAPGTLTVDTQSGERVKVVGFCVECRGEARSVGGRPATLVHNASCSERRDDGD